MHFTNENKKIWQSPFFKRLLILILIVISLGTATFAWVSMNTDNKGGNLKLSVDYDRFYVDHAYYKYNPKEEDVEVYDNLTDVEFNQYDLVFRSRNKYTPIVATLMLTGEDLDKESGTITIQIKRDNSAAYTTSGNTMALAQKFTSIMRVSAYVGKDYYNADEYELYKNVDRANYETVRAYTGNVGTTSKVFTTATTSGNTLTNVTKQDVEISIDYNNTNFNIIDGKETLIVYLYITYDEGFDGTDYNGLIGIYQRTSDSMGISAAGELSDTSVHFENDLVSVKVSHS